MIDRRQFAAGLCGMGLAGLSGQAFAESPEGAFASIESASGGRLGVAALDTRDGRRIGHRADERFPMCSTFKLLAAGAILARADAGHEKLDNVVRFSAGNILSYAPVTKERLA